MDARCVACHGVDSCAVTVALVGAVGGLEEGAGKMNAIIIHLGLIFLAAPLSVGELLANAAASTGNRSR